MDFFFFWDGYREYWMDQSHIGLSSTHTCFGYVLHNILLWASCVGEVNRKRGGIPGALMGYPERFSGGIMYHILSSVYLERAFAQISLMSDLPVWLSLFCRAQQDIVCRWTAGRKGFLKLSHKKLTWCDLSQMYRPEYVYGLFWLTLTHLATPQDTLATEQKHAETDAPAGPDARLLGL